MDATIADAHAPSASSRIEVFARIRPSVSGKIDAVLSQSDKRNGGNAVPPTPKGLIKKDFVGSLTVDNAAPCNAKGLPTVVIFGEDTAASRFELDGVFDAGASQREVFGSLGTQHVASVIEGFNSTIFAYGRTSSGKTHTITGPLTARGGSDGGWSLRELEREAADPLGCPSQLGLVPRSLHALLRAVEAARDGRHFTACFACAEIYTRSLFDLCTDDGGRAEVRDGRMSASAAERLTWHHIDVRAGHEDDAMLAVQGLVQRANAARATAATAANSDSSRSHVLYMARVSSVGADGTARNALLSIVDLAGSESLDTAPAAPGGGGAGDLGGMGSPKGTAAAGGRDAETRAINSSLHTLTRVVAAFATAPAGQRPAHVPFRESLLTLMLRDSIGGNCRTSVVVTLSGDDDQLHHSLKSCAFARLARGVSNCARANRSYDPAIALDALRAQVAELTRALAEAEAARDVATSAAAGMAQGSLDGLLESACPSPSSSAEKGGSVDVRLDSHVRGWVEGALPWDDEEALRAAVRRLAAVADSLRRCVRATGISTRLDSPPREDAGTATTPLRGGREPPAAVHAGTQASPPPAMLAAGVHTPSPPHINRPVVGSSAGKPTSPAQLAPSEARAALRAAGHSLADACETFASELEARTLPAARVLVDVAARVARDGDVAAAEGRVRMLEAQVALTRARAVELRAVGGDEGVTSTRPVDGDATAIASTSALPPLGPSALRAWQVCSESSDGTESTWDLLPHPVAALLDSVVLRQSQGAVGLAGTALAVVVVSGSTPPYVMQAPHNLHVSRVAAPAPSHEAAAAASASPAAHGEKNRAAEPAVVCHPALEAAWAQRLGFDGVEPFLCSILNPWSGVQVCCVTGAERPIRRTTAAVMQGALYKRGARSNAWTARPFMLTSSGLHQLHLVTAAAAGVALKAATPAAQARHVAESIAKTKIAFRSDVSTRAELAPADMRGAHAAAQVRFFVTQQRGSSGRGLSALSRCDFAVGSLDEATRWIDAINAAAAGAFEQTRVACTTRWLPATSESAATELWRLAHFLADAQLRLQLRSSSGRGAAETLSSAPPLLGGAITTAPESAGAQSPDAVWFCGRGPAGVPALLPMSPTQWRATGEDLVAELLAADGFARLARILGYPTYSVLVLAAARVQCSAAAAAFDIRATGTAMTGRRVLTAFVVASSRAVLRRLVGHAGGVLLPPAPCGQGGTPGLTASGSLLPRCDTLPCGYASAACALDAHVAQLLAVRDGAGGDMTESAGATFSHAASLLAMVVLRAAVPVAQATDGSSGGAMGSESLAVNMFHPVHIVWMQVAPGLASGRPSLG